MMASFMTVHRITRRRASHTGESHRRVWRIEDSYWQFDSVPFDPIGLRRRASTVRTGAGSRDAGRGRHMRLIACHV